MARYDYSRKDQVFYLSAADHIVADFIFIWKSNGAENITTSHYCVKVTSAKIDLYGSFPESKAPFYFTEDDKDAARSLREGTGGSPACLQVAADR